MVIVGGDFDEVYADDFVGLGDVLQQLQHFVVEEAAVARRACARRDGGAEGIDIKGDIDAGLWRDAFGCGLGAEFAHLADGEDIGAHFAGGLVAFLRGGADIADADLGEACDIGLFGGAAHRVAVAVTNAVADIDEIKVGVDLEDVDIALALKGVDAGDVDGVIAAYDHGEGARGEGGAHACLDIGVALVRVCVDDIGIAHVHDAHIACEVGCVILVVICACVAKGEERGGFAHGAGAEARARAVLCARIKGRAEHGDIGLKRAPVGGVGALGEGGDPDEGEIEAACVVAVLGHGVLLSFGRRVLRGRDFGKPATLFILGLGREGRMAWEICCKGNVMRSKTGFGEQTPPAIFSLILGMFGLSLSWRAAANTSILPAGISEAILGGVLIVFIIAAAAYMRKLLLRAGTLVEDARILPGRGGLAAFGVCFAILAAGLVPIAPEWAERILYLALAVQGGMAVLVVYVLLSGPKEQRQVTPLWHLSFVGFIVSAVSAVNLGFYGLAEAIFWPTLGAALLIWGVSAMQLRRHVPPAPLRPMLAIHLAPASLFVIVALGFPAQDYPVMALLAQVFAGVAALILLGLLFSLKSLLEAGFSPMWASFTFPLSAFATAMLSLAGQTGGVAERLVGGIALVAASTIVPYIAVKVIRMWMTGQLALKTNAAKA